VPLCYFLYHLLEEFSSENLVSSHCSFWGVCSMTGRVN
jgi:hypothetical protein